jgi:seryl-tRNA(Sec) selenium transferase
MLWFLTVIDWFKAKALFLFGIVVAALTAYSAIRRQGKQAAQIEHLEQSIKNVRKKDEVTQKIERLPDGDAASRLRDKWSRD